jgi:hypothetical protein
MAIDYAERARALVGTRFRPQGRSETELDCVGVILSTFGLAADSVRRDYRLRGDHRSEIESELTERFRRVPKSQLRSGDVMLLEVAAEQLHLAVRTGLGFVHGHAGIGRVVETPGLPEWRLLGVYRKRRER